MSWLIGLRGQQYPHVFLNTVKVQALGALGCIGVSMKYFYNYIILMFLIQLRTLVFLMKWMTNYCIFAGQCHGIGTFAYVSSEYKELKSLSSGIFLNY